MLLGVISYHVVEGTLSAPYLKPNDCVKMKSTPLVDRLVSTGTPTSHSAPVRQDVQTPLMANNRTSRFPQTARSLIPSVRIFQTLYVLLVLDDQPVLELLFMHPI